MEDPPLPGYRIHRSIPPQGATTHVVVPGERFRAGGFKRWFYGENYRDLWNTPVEVAVLDLDSVGGGLTPLRTGGFGQSISLHFTGKDGRRYTVRSLDKDATRRVPDEIANTAVGEVLQDLICAMLPTGALVVDPLMEAAGILHSRHTLVVIPDDPRLKEHRGRFAGLIGMLQEHPSEGKDDAPGFAGSRKVSGTDKLMKHLEKSPCNRLDARAFLKARLMDFLVNDKDRHYGQWRWARFPDGDCYTWLPIPEDRDQAFIHFEGAAMAIARRRFPIQIKFKETYPNLIGLTMTGWEIDREFLAELDKDAWDSVVSAFQEELPDPVIEDAVRRLPPPYYTLVGENLTRVLKRRRDALPEFAGRYYQLINREAEIKTTDKDEYVHCEHLSNGNLRVRIGMMKGGGEERKAPYFQRTFRHEETREVRIHLRGGDDRAEISGAKGRIVVRINGGGGDDTLSNSSHAGASKTRFYDSRGKNRFVEGEGAGIEEHSYKRPHGTHTPNARYALDWGMQTGSLPIFMIDPDLTVYMGALHSRQYFGYRKDPFSSHHTYIAGLAGVNGFESLRPFFSYTGHFRRPLREFDVKVHFDFSGIRSLRFYGFGNKTEIRRPSSFYRMTRYSLAFAPALAYRGADYSEETSGFSLASLRSRLNVHFGPIIKYSNTPSGSNRGTLIGSLDDRLYGTGAFGQIGTRGEITFDTRDNPGYPTRGIRVSFSGAIYPEIWNVDSPFSSIKGEASSYLTARIPTQPTLALRGGARKVWGSFPFFESAFLGGTGVVGTGISGGNLRGFQKNRFAGDASLYGNSELRLVLTEIELFVAGELGLFGTADAGRVFYDGDPAGAGKWHTGIGGGIWLSFLRSRHTISAAVVKGDDLTGVYLRGGFMF
ncbi:MAG: BamA/TamA family outer membrane protein [Gemmatimonadota bacterium]|nr:BamA/TamA family outer membrane protein [Gemmatimonadota bacterium]